MSIFLKNLQQPEYVHVLLNHLPLTGLFAAALASGQRRLALIGEGDLAEIANLIASKHQIEICGTLAATHDPVQLRKIVEELGKIDAVVITEMREPREVFEAAVQQFGAERVWVPELLGVRVNTQAGVES